MCSSHYRVLGRRCWSLICAVIQKYASTHAHTHTCTLTGDLIDFLLCTLVPQDHTLLHNHNQQDRQLRDTISPREDQSTRWISEDLGVKGCALFLHLNQTVWPKEAHSSESRLKFPHDMWLCTFGCAEGLSSLKHTFILSEKKKRHLHRVK